jgi:hypothetical protein
VTDIVVECVRDADRLETKDRFRLVAARLAPSHLEQHEPRFVEAPGFLAMLVNPSHHGVRVERGGILLGALMAGAGPWWQTRTAPPEGTYALLRYDEVTVELHTDMGATRTLWYVADGDRLLASTSQRALVALLGSLEVDEGAAAWLLAAGTLGPDLSWDSRLKRLPPDATLRLDRTSWRVSVEDRPVEFTPVVRSEHDHAELLREAIARSCAGLDVDMERWVLPLSGGADSRTILAFTAAAGRHPSCVTWATRASLRNPASDAVLARLLARRFGSGHRYLYLDAPAHAATAVDTFIANSEGRTDEFAGYVDGCDVWRDLFAAGTAGVIRGDESFTHYQPPADAASARRGCGGVMVDDHPAGHVIHELGLAGQVWPERMSQRPGESLLAHYHRLDQLCYFPSSLAPLNDLKGRYVEVANPLESHAVVRFTRTLPDELRLRGRAYMAIAARLAWPVPFARFSATPGPSAFLSDPGVLGVVVRELTSARMERVMSEEAAMRLLVALTTPAQGGPTPRNRVVAAMKAARVVVPARLGDLLVPPYRGPDRLPASRLAFRAMLASRTVALLHQDAALLGHGPVGVTR